MTYFLLALALAGLGYWLHRTFAVSLHKPTTRVEQLRALLEK